MPFHYACFVSYRVGREPGAVEFYKKFRDLLAEQLDYLVPDFGDKKVFFDRERLTGGSFFEEELCDALAHSVCMVLVYTPQYFSESHPFCAREYKTMLELERCRSAVVPELTTRGLILPVVHRKHEPRGDDLPAELSSRQFFTFGRKLIGHRHLDGDGVPWEIWQEIGGVFIGIAEAVYDRYRLLRDADFDPHGHCGDARMPAEADITDWLRRVTRKPRLPHGGTR